MSDENEVKLTIRILGKYSSHHEREIIKAPYETDAAFFVRAQKMLDELRQETP